MTEDLFEAASRLADILAAENAALEALDLAGAVALLPGKRSAAEAFIAAQSAPMADNRRGDIERVSRQLQPLAEQNKALLSRAMAVQNRVIALIARATALPNYGASHGYGHTARPTAFAIVARA